MVRRVYVEKKPSFAVQAKDLRHEIRHYLNIAGCEDVRVFIRYDVENISDEVFEQAAVCVFSEPPVDRIYFEKLPEAEDAHVFSVEYYSKSSGNWFYGLFSAVFFTLDDLGNCFGKYLFGIFL